MKHFLTDIKILRFRFSNTLYTDIVIDLFDVVAVIDDFSNLQKFKNRPVLKRASADISGNQLCRWSNIDYARPAKKGF